MNLKPLQDRVVVKPAEADEVSKGGIILPDTAKVKKGDKILYGKYSGTEITIDSVEYLIVRESDIFAIL